MAERNRWGWMLCSAAVLAACGETHSSEESLSSARYDLVTLRERTTMIQNALDPLATGPAAIPAPSGKCMDARWGATSNGTAVQLWDCNDTDAQLWAIEYPLIKGVGSGRCLDVVNNGSANGTGVQIWDCNGSPQQRWTTTPQGQFLSMSTGKCLDIEAQGGSGSALQLWDCSSRGSQRWTRRPTILRNTRSSKCLTASASDYSVFIATCTGLPAQQWHFTNGSALFNPATQACISSSTSGQPLGIDVCADASAWQWRSDGSLRASPSLACMDVTFGNTAEGTPVQLWGCNGTNSQEWIAR